MAILHDVVVDCRHHASLARFWSAALDGYRVAPYDDAELERLRAAGINDPEDDPSVLVESDPGVRPRFWFTLVPEQKVTKNRRRAAARAARARWMRLRRLWLGGQPFRLLSH